MTLREKAQEWLNKYKAGDTYGGNTLSLEDIAAVVAEYLRESGDSAKKIALEGRVEFLHEDLIEAQNKAEELRKENEKLRSQLRLVEKEMDSMDGQITAYKFVIRCNGVSGAEVRP